MTICIKVDRLGGHLFHVLELYIVAFVKCKSSKTNVVWKLNEKHDINKRFYQNKWVECLCEKLFSQPLKIWKETDKIEETIDRWKLDHRNVNKAFITAIKEFDKVKWYNLISPNTPTKSVLYVTRQSANRRRLNEEDDSFLTNIVKNYGGETFDCSYASPQEQIDKFREYKIVIGLHGNNLSGIMWMYPGTHVLEIIPVTLKHLVYDYECLALTIGVNYTQIDCDCQNKTLNSTFMLTSKSMKQIKDKLTILNAYLF